MTPERWRQITGLFHRALLLDEASRGSFLDEACAGDAALRSEVSGLLDANRDAGGFGARPVAGTWSDLEALFGVPEAGVPDHAIAPGTILGHYRIERPLGRGGMGAVFLAYDTTLQRQVALKVLDRPADEQTTRAKLLREARNAAALNHPNICTIHEVGEADGTAFIAMAYVEGRTLRHDLDRGALAIDDVLRYGVQAADALAHAHEHDVVHRDFKAANAIVTATGRLMIVDFGLARRGDAVAREATTAASIEAGTVAGTPYAMAPEQVRGEAADGRADIWALGVLLYEMAGGARPFDADSVPELFSSILRDPPPPLPSHVPVPLAATIDRCLQKDPAQRYQRAEEVRAALAGAAIETAAPRPAHPRDRVRRLLLAAGLLTVVLAALVGFNARGVRDRLLGSPADAAPITLAVLPFENLTGDPAQEYFSDGLTDELISRLGRLRPERLRVVARTSSMRFKRTNTPLDQIGRALGAGYVLEGSARREGGRVRIGATLIDVSDQTQRWTATYDRELAGILGLQSDVAEAVAGSLAVTLLPEVKDEFRRAKPVDPDAYEAYLEGRSHAIRLTRPDLDAAEKYFDLALSKDPAFALGHVGLSLVWSGRQQMQFVPPEVAAPKLRAAASRAIELDDTLPEAHLMLANALAWTDWNWPAAEPEFTRAIALRPNYAEARAFYSHYLYIMQRPAEAQAQMQQAVALDPLSEFVKAFSAVGLFMARRFDDATVQLRDVLKTNPNSPMALTALSEALHYTRHYDDALAVERARWRARGDKEIDEALQRGFVEAGYGGAMRRAADLQAIRSTTSRVLPLAVAKLYARAGQQREREIEWLEKAVDARDPNVPYIGAMPIFDGLRPDPRFQRLLERLHLPR